MVFFPLYGEPDDPTDFREFDPAAFFVADYALELEHGLVDPANFGDHFDEWYSVADVWGHIFPQTSDDLLSFRDPLAQFLATTCAHITHDGHLGIQHPSYALSDLVN